MNKRSRQIQMLKIGAVWLAILFYVVTWGQLKSWQLVFGFALAGLVFGIDWLYRQYEDHLLRDLSELIGGLMNREKPPVFSDVEDTLLSKLQSQITKLSDILEAQSRKSREEREKLQALVSDLSHQLKTPVASAQMFGELLQKEDLTIQERQEYVEILRQSLEKLVFLTDSMIKMSRLETGLIQLRRQDTAAAEIALAAIRQVYPKAKARDTEIIFADEAEAELTLDAAWTVEALVNVLDNGIKYCPPGSRLEVRIISYESYVAIRVSDNGPGIAEDEQARIFQRFYRGRAASRETGAEKGVGIGLYLTRQIVQDEGGYVKVSSDGSQGTAFTLFFPRKRKEMACPAEGRVL